MLHPFLPNLFSESKRVVVAAEVSGTVFVNNAEGRKGQGRILISLEINANLVQNIANLSTTSSGSFTGIDNAATSGSAIITISSDTIQFINTGVNAHAGSIVYSGIVSNSAATISNNLINKFTVSSTGANAQILGINISGGYASTISGNVISNLSTASNKTTANAETGTPAGSAITGILNSTTVSGQIIK